MERQWCAKRQYPSEEDARAAFERIHKKAERLGRRREGVIYTCPRCHAWHTRSWPLGQRP